MVFLKSFKNQSWLLPPCIEELIPEDHICYLVESFIESLDFSAFDEKYDGAGHPTYHPRILLKLLLMGMLDKNFDELPDYVTRRTIVEKIKQNYQSGDENKQDKVSDPRPKVRRHQGGCSAHIRSIILIMMFK